MPLKYGIIGASGRMGKEIESIMNEAGHVCVFKYDENGEWSTENPEVIIDFSLPQVFEQTLFYIGKFKVPLIMGTTGLSNTQINALKELGKEVPVVHSSNYSIGIQMMIKCAELLNENLPDWDVEICETHHRFKKDKPSGTALMIKNALGKDINISSLRLGNVPGDHTVSFGGLGEVLSITHCATSRRTFSEGVLKSALFVVNKKNGYYSFKEVLFHK